MTPQDLREHPAFQKVMEAAETYVLSAIQQLRRSIGVELPQRPTLTKSRTALEAALLALCEQLPQPVRERACIDCGGPIVYGQKCAVCGQMPETVNGFASNLNQQYAAAITRPLETLLRRIRQWDHLDTAGDGAYWKREIDIALTANSEAQAVPAEKPVPNSTA